MVRYNVSRNFLTNLNHLSGEVLLAGITNGKLAAGVQFGREIVVRLEADF